MFSGRVHGGLQSSITDSQRRLTIGSIFAFTASFQSGGATTAGYQCEWYHKPGSCHRFTCATDCQL
jgi:hypothetical protein